MQINKYLFPLTISTLLLQATQLTAIDPDNILCMWDRPFYPCTSAKNYVPPPRIPANTPRETTTRQIDGTNIWSQSIGTGNPLIVLHGGPGLSHDYLMPHLEQLAKNNRVIFYDQRGCGKSEGCMEPERITMEQYVNDIEEIRKSYGYQRVSLLGHSWGGYLAMNYAIAYPNNVEKLVLVNSLPATSDGFGLFAEEYVRRTAPFQDKLDYLANSPEFRVGDPVATEEYYKTIFKTYVQDSTKVDSLNLRMTPEASMNGRIVGQIFAEDLMSTPYDLRSSLKLLNIPTLVIHGDVDPIPAFVAEETHKNIPGSKFVLINNSGHFPYVESPDIFFDTVATFLK